MIDPQTIQWFPGHMAKTRRIMGENLRLVDMAVEILDARIPQSSRNPEIDRILGQKPRLILLNKCDSADEAVTKAWCQYYATQGIVALPVDCKSGKGLGQLLPAARKVLTTEMERRARKGMTGNVIRMMIVGIPNVGKSSFINKMAGSKRAKVEDRPGVTRGKQWVSLDNGLELLDMPGVLWPKFEDLLVGEHLAFTGAIKDDVLDMEQLAMRFLQLLAVDYPSLLTARYNLAPEDLSRGDGSDLLELVGRKRGMLLAGGVVNTERAAITILDEFRAGTIGHISLERPPVGKKKAVKAEPAQETVAEEAPLPEPAPLPEEE